MKQKVMAIQTDSTPLEDSIDPDTCTVFTLIQLFATDDQRNEIAEKYGAGGYGYGRAKTEMLGMITEYFAEARERRKEQEKDMDYVHDVLKEGGKWARERAEIVMKPIRSTIGLYRSFSI